MTKELIMAGTGLSLFIICPRMAAMVNIISKHSDLSLVYVSLIGAVLAIPMIVGIALIFSKFGLWGALLFCIATDIGAAFMMKEISIKASIETIVIALFVILGVKVAPFISSIIIKS